MIRRGIGVALMVILGGGLPQGVDAQGLHILLTNDDGYDAPGIMTLRAALVEAGHRVTIVAPAERQSGAAMGSAITGTIDWTREADDVWAVRGTPADAVSLALVHMLRDDPPDLVISGMNFGHNVGASVLGSGTVGAALTASRAGVPAIAMSIAIDFEEAGADPAYPSTSDALEPAAALVVNVVEQLHQSDAQGFLPPRTVLNINYPAVGGGDVVGVRFAPVASVRPYRSVYSVSSSGGRARVQLAAGDASRAEGGSDYDLLMDGYVTVSVLDGDLDAGRASWEPLLERLILER